MRDHRDAVLRFTVNPEVPPTNNLAEQGVRPEKVQQKISGRFRSRSGATNRTIIRTVLGTARKQGWNRLDTLRRSPHELSVGCTRHGRPEIIRHTSQPFPARGVPSRAPVTASQVPRVTVRPVIIPHDSWLHG
ncbi:MAG: transposase [Aestuariivita sp.]|nr:transposase [Aestuariivita sp.]